MSLLFAGIEKNQRFFVVSFGPSYNGSTQGWGSCSGSPILPGPKLTIAIPRVVRVRFSAARVLMTHLLKKFEDFLQSIDLNAYRQKYRPIMIVEMDLPKEVQAIAMLYKIYWDEKRFLTFEDFYREYYDKLGSNIRKFQRKTGMCRKCFSKGLPARIYRTWASIITQIHAGYVAESVFGNGSVAMSDELDHKGADFQVRYRDKILNYQIKKKSLSREVRQEKPKSKSPLAGEFVDLRYEVPSSDYFENPKKNNGEYKLPYQRFQSNKELKRFPNGFVIFTPYAFQQKKKEMDVALK